MDWSVGDPWIPALSDRVVVHRLPARCRASVHPSSTAPHLTLRMGEARMRDGIIHMCPKRPKNARCCWSAPRGGHLLQLLALEDAWRRFRAHWVTFDKPDARSLLEGERVRPRLRPDEPQHPEPPAQPAARAARAAPRARPRDLSTTGAGVAVPFAWLGRLLGARVVYVESVTRIERAVAQRAPDPAGRQQDVRPVARARGRVAGARYSGNLLVGADDLRHRRHERAAASTGWSRAASTLPAATRSWSSSTGRRADHDGAAVARFLQLRGDASSDARARASSSATPASARSCSPAAAASARS